MTTSLWFRGAINVDITENVVPYVPVITAEKAYQVVNGLVPNPNFTVSYINLFVLYMVKFDELVVSN